MFLYQALQMPLLRHVDDAQRCCRCCCLPMQAELARGNGAASSEAMSLGKYAGTGPQVLQALTQRVSAATGLHVQLRARSGPGCGCGQGPLHAACKPPCRMLEMLPHADIACRASPEREEDMRNVGIECRAQPEQATEVRLVVAGILSAAVALAAAGQPQAVRVSLMSAEEHAAGSLDAWQASQHQVFRCALNPSHQGYCKRCNPGYPGFLLHLAAAVLPAITWSAP